MGSTASVGEREVVGRFGELDRLLGVAAEAVRPDGWSAHCAEQVQDRLISMAKRISGMQTLVADRAAEGSGWRGRGARSAADDLARRSGTSTAKAKDTLDASKKAKSQPKVADALAAGELSDQQASLITDAAAANPDAEADLLAAAKDKDLSGLRDTCGRAKAAADRDPEATQARLHRERYLRYGKRADGSFSGSFKLAPDAGAHFDALMQPFVQAEARQAKKDRRPDTIEQLSADALVAMAHSAVTGTGKNTATQVNVLVDRDALVRGHCEGEERCEYSTCIGPIQVPVSVVQEILSDAFLVGMFRDGIDVQAQVRFGRRTSVAVRDALRVRDDFTCTIAGCNRRARLELDHKEPVAAGGPDRYTNLEHLCWHHHLEKTATDRAATKARRGPDP